MCFNSPSYIHDPGNRPRVIVIILIALLHVSPILSGAVTFKAPSGQILGRTGALNDDAWSFFTNPAGAAKMVVPVAGIGYQNDYLLNELSSRSALFVVPTSLCVGATGFSHYGFRHFSIQNYSLMAARELAPWLNMGMRFNYHLRQQTGSKNFGLLTIDTGIQFFPDEKVSIGFFVSNPGQVKWDLDEIVEYHPTFVSSAIQYQPVPALKFELGVAKEMELPAAISFFMEGPLHPQFLMRGGAATSPLRLGIGAGVIWQSLMFDIGLNHHSTLGLSSSFGILFNLPSIKRRQSEAGI
ncbi:hypothetical protein [Alkaliflexus imshenetskii]|uniref:hypothetical protein n=1 Tax=Alkaliflexus imshenetskii TaxID=286730 RepID=UPI00047A2D4C|nr:hypothetical protein [Alkaliflexus imshenetskii]